jgi:hypothetical protein
MRLETKTLNLSRTYLIVGLGCLFAWPRKKKRKPLSSADKIVTLETHRMGQQASPPSGYVLRAREQIDRNQANLITEWSTDADR